MLKHCLNSAITTTTLKRTFPRQLSGIQNPQKPAGAQCDLGLFYEKDHIRLSDYIEGPLELVTAMPSSLAMRKAKALDKALWWLPCLATSARSWKSGLLREW